MKKITLSISALVMLAFVSCGPTAKDAVAYNDNIMTIVNNVTLAQNDFFDQTDGHNMDSLVLTLKTYSAKSKTGLDEINKLAPFAEKREFLDAAVNFVKTLNALADNESKQMVEIMTKDSAAVTEAYVTKVEELSDKLNSESEKVSKVIEDAQTAFKNEWKFEIDATKH